MASSAGCSRTGANSRPPIRPAPAPMSVSTTRSLAAVLLPTADRISMALIGTSRMSSPSRRMSPTASATAIRMPRLHQVKPTMTDRPTASRTPASTLSTRWPALRRVWDRLTWMTRSAVSGASTGPLLPANWRASR